MMKLVVLILFIVLTATIGGVIIAGRISTKYIEGTVADYQTSELIPDTKVSANQIGWGFMNGRLVWDKPHIFKTISDKDGRFKIEYAVGSSAHVKAVAEGYVAYDGWHPNNSFVDIKLKRENTDYTPLPHGVLQLGIKNFKPYGWIFSEKRITFNRTEADIFPKFDEKFGIDNITIETPGFGGITFVSKDELGVEYNLLVYSDVAPIDGYVPALTFDLDLNIPKGIYFVKTHDGKHFAKFSSIYTTVGSEQEYKQGNWGLRLEYVYNPDGTRNLEFQR